MGSSQTKEKSRSSSPSEKVVEGLKEKVRLLQGEINEIMCMREKESEEFERELMVFAFKQAEWKRERKGLKEEAKKLKKALEDQKQEKLRCMKNCDQFMIPINPTCCNNNNIITDQIKEEQIRRDETLEKWKQLYFAIKVELDDLIQRTRQEERLCWKIEEEDVLLELKQELTAKEERIEFLQAKLVSMEHQELRREREIDILRQSLRIMSHKKRATKHEKRSNQAF